MKKIITFITFILILTSLGCKTQTPNLQPTVIDYHKGTQGLEILPVKNLPPENVNKNNDFVIGFELRNKGAYDITGGRITLYGFELGYNLVKNPEQRFDIEGKQPGFPEGGYEIINFNVKNLGIQEPLKNQLAAYTIRACYRYRTEAGTEVCINPNIYSYSKTKESICEPEEIVLRGGQGAPVTITKVEESFSPLGNKIQVNFVITFANKGDGEVTSGVYVTDVRLANAPINCQTTESIELKKGEEKSIICTTDILVSSGAYISPLSIILDYDYTTYIDGSVNIKSLI